MSIVPTFFKSPADFRIWLAKHHHSELALLVGFYKIGSGKPSMLWSESVDEALCFGWIDGVRKRIDDAAYSIRLTPRKSTSIWSSVNIAKFTQLQAQGRLTPAGEAAFANRKAEKSEIYAYEQAFIAELSAEELREFKRNKMAWKFFEDTPSGYKKVLLHWVTTAKKTETRASRLATLVAACAAGKRLR